MRRTPSTKLLTTLVNLSLLKIIVSKKKHYANIMTCSVNLMIEKISMSTIGNLLLEV